MKANLQTAKQHHPKHHHHHPQCVQDVRTGEPRADFKLFSKGLGPMAIAKRLEGVVSRSTVYKTVKDYKYKGKTERKPSTQKASVRTAPLMKRVREKIRQDPRRSMRRMAREVGVSKTIMWRLCQEDLGMIPSKKQHWQVLSEATKAKYLE